MKTNRLIATLITGALLTATGRAQDAGATPPAAPGANQASRGKAMRGPREVIIETLRTEIGRKLKDAGATCDDLQVTVAVDRDSATPFKVSYSGLKNFKGSDGTTPDANGSFIMEYIGGASFQGKLAGTQFTVPVGRTDNIDLPFVNDPQVIGEWESVDFVSDISEFDPGQTSWGGERYLKGLTFKEGGKTGKPWWTWTKGVVMHHGDKTASRYEIKEIKGQSYLFFEWKSGDVTISGMKPQYYVLKKKAGKDTQ
jgi:hypothetical protein